MLQQAMAFFEEMDASGLAGRVFAYNAMISVCCRAKEWRLAEEVFNRMVLAGVQVPPYQCVVCLFGSKRTNSPTTKLQPVGTEGNFGVNGD